MKDTKNVASKKGPSSSPYLFGYSRARFLITQVIPPCSQQLFVLFNKRK